MHNKLRVTLTSLSVALGFVAATLMLAQPVASVAVLDRGAAVRERAPNQGDAAAAAAAAEHDRHSARFNLTMPYYSFARLLPRRES